MRSELRNERRRRTMKSSPKTASAPLCPIEQRTPTGVAAVLLFILVTLSSAAVGVGLAVTYDPAYPASTAVEIASVVLSVLLFLFIWKGTPSAKGAIPLLILGGGVISFFTASLIPAAALVCLVFSVGAGGFLISVLPRKALLLSLLIPAAVYGITAAVTLNPLVGLLGLIPFPAMAAMGLGTRNSASREGGLTRVGVICLTSVTLLLTLGGAFLLCLILTVEDFSFAGIPTMLEAFREAYIVETVTEYNEQLAALEIPEGTSQQIVEILTRKLTYKEAANMVNTTLNLLPCIIVTVINVAVTLSQMITHAALRSFGQEASVTDRVKVFRMSLISCIVFTAAYFTTLGFILDLAAGSESTLGGVIALNIFVILIPGLAFSGLLRIMDWLRKKNPRSIGCLITAFLFIPLFWILAPLALPIVEVIWNAASAFATLFTFDDDPA